MAGPSGSNENGARKRVRLYRGSNKRVQRITLRGNWSLELWAAVAIVALALLILVPLLMRSAL